MQAKRINLNKILKKLYNNKVWISLLLLTLIPSISYAFGFTVDKEIDKSYEYLNGLFGEIPKILTQAPQASIKGNEIVGRLLVVFNIVVLAVGSIVVSYSIMMSTFNTAQEGEAMGRKWSSNLIPLKSGLGLAMLVPAPQFSLIQMIIMFIILQGVGAGNKTWNKVLDFVQSGQSISTNQEQPPAPIVIPRLVDKTAQNAIRAISCLENENELNEETDSPDRINIRRSSDNKSVVIGYPPDGTECGVFSPGIKPSPFKGDEDKWNETQLRAIERMLQVKSPFSANDIYEAKNEMIDIILSFYESFNFNPTSGFLDNIQTARDDGWISAGVYFFNITQPSGKIIPSDDYSTPDYISGTIRPKLSEEEIINRSLLNQPKQVREEDPTQSVPSCITNGATLQPDPLSGKVEVDLPFFGSWLEVPFEFVAGIFVNSLSKIFGNMRAKVTCKMLDSESTPLASIKETGKEIVRTVDIFLSVCLMVVTLLLLGSCVGTVLSPVCFMTGGIIALAAPFMMAIIVILYATGIVYALYIPIIPFLVFTLTSIGWLILCIEAILAGPIVALGLVSPSHQALGKAAPAISIMVNLFLRPSLMIVGFVAAASLVTAISRILMETFELTIADNLGGTYGLFAMLALVTLFAGIVTTLYHKAFSTVYILPDKISRWIGGQAENTGSDVETTMREAKSSAEKGAGIGAKMAKSAMETIGKGAQHASDKGHEDMGGKFFSRGGHSAHSKRGREAGWRTNAKGEHILSGPEKHTEFDPRSGIEELKESIRNAPDNIKQKAKNLKQKASDLISGKQDDTSSGSQPPTGEDLMPSDPSGKTPSAPPAPKKKKTKRPKNRPQQDPEGPDPDDSNEE